MNRTGTEKSDRSLAQFFVNCEEPLNGFRVRESSITKRGHGPAQCLDDGDLAVVLRQEDSGHNKSTAFFFDAHERPVGDQSPDVTVAHAEEVGEFRNREYIGCEFFHGTRVSECGP